MTTHHDFELIREQYLAEMKTTAQLFRHVRTGTELLSLINDDENKVFGIAFRTPPSNSTGIAHILEHSVLCGSRKYPVKEPFVELLKGSLKTFLNAFTYPDKTCYPVASQNTQDFYNLIDVYLDAVFYPRLTPAIFQQEGWHLELLDPAAPLALKGVVYNEMKGVYSSPDSLLAEYSQQVLFPDTTYGLDSGGDPSIIPELTFEQFKAFHEEFYHPSNARIYFYGDDDPHERLRIVNNYLQDFERIQPHSTIRLQPSFTRPQRIERSFAAAEQTSTGSAQVRSGMLTMNWLVGEITDAELNLGLHILEYILLGMPGSPLRKALIDSGLGEGVTGTGLEGELRQMFFSTGLKGIAPDTADQIESLIIQTLTRLTEQGIDPKTVEAAVNTIEFRLRENNTGSYPRGLVLMLRALTTWLYDGDPLTPLAFEPPLNALKSRWTDETGYFETLIRRFYLDNPHRVTLLMRPDPSLEKRHAEAERERLEQLRNQFSPAQLQEVIDNTQSLQQLQTTPDSPEALATIPSLRVEDLDKKNKIIPKTVFQKNGSQVLYHDLSTNGITYLDVGFNLHLLPQDCLPYVPLFTRALLEIGTRSEDFVTFSQRIGRKTGGIHPEFFTSALKEGTRAAVWFFLRGKSMLPQTADLLHILQDMLFTVQLDNRERFRQMALEEKAKHEQKLIPAGHQVVNLRLKAHFTEADWAAEQMNGVSYLMFLRQLLHDIDSDWPQVLNTLETMRRVLVNRNRMLFNVTVDKDGWTQFEPQLEAFLQALPVETRDEVDWTPQSGSPFEALVMPAQVNYVGKGTNIYELGYRFHGSILVITRYLRNSWLWERIRVQGGAYGAFCLLDRLSGMLTFVSYRDPNLLKTLDNFDQTADFLRHVELNDEEIGKAVIGTIGDIDSYMLPDTKGYISLLQHLTGDTEELRQQLRDEVLATTVADFRAFAETLQTVKEHGIVKVLGGQSAVDQSLADRQEWLKVVKVL